MIGRVRVLHARMTASVTGTPRWTSCTEKSTSSIELRTMMPASAIQPIIEVAVNSAPIIACMGIMPNNVSGIGAMISAGILKLPNSHTTNI